MAETQPVEPSAPSPRRAELPDEIIVPYDWRTVQILIAGLIALFFLGNLALLPLQRAQDSDPGSVESRWHSLSTFERPHDWVVLGDSSAGAAINPAVLTAELGGTAINLALPGGPPFLDSWFLNEYAVHNGLPRHIIVQHVYDVWPRDTAIASAARIPIPAAMFRDMHPPLHLRFRQRLNLFAERYLTAFRLRNGLRSRLRRVPAQLSRLLRGKELAPWAGAELVRSPDGFEPAYKHDEQAVRDDTDYHRRIVAEPGFKFEISESSEQGLRNILEVTAAQGVPVYFPPSPMFEGIANEPGYQHFHAGWLAYMRELIAPYPHAHILDQMPYARPAEDFSNTVDHLVVPAAADHTRLIAEAIRATHDL